MPIPYDNFPSEEDNSGMVAPAAPKFSLDPVDLTDIPTSTTDVLKPRTLAAGYDDNRRVMTVVFRDGTVFNYYDVSPGEWSTFHASISKGELLVKGSPLDGKQRAKASLSDLSPEIFAEISYAARIEQLRHVRPRRSRTASGKLSYATNKSALGRSRRAGALPTHEQIRKTVQGKNTATAGRPHKPHKPRKK